jgi:hypothetical protein
MYKVFGKCLVNHEPFTVFKGWDKYKTGDIIWDGKPTTISLGESEKKETAEHFAENVRKNVTKKTWKIWVEEIK